jgi:hypothetical protein
MTEVELKSVSKENRHIKKMSIYKKSHISCPILMKLGEINHLMRLLFLTRVMRIGQGM